MKTPLDQYDSDPEDCPEPTETERALLDQLLVASEARQRVIDMLPLLRLALEMAKIQVGVGGHVGIAVVAVRADGSGNIAAKWEGEQFLNDIAELAGVKDQPGWMQPEPLDESDDGDP